MSKFNWDEFVGYDKLAMDADGCVYAYRGEIVYDEEEGVWISEDPSSNTLLLFEPALEVLQGFVEPIERPDLPPDWWFENNIKQQKWIDSGLVRCDGEKIYRVSREEYNVDNLGNDVMIPDGQEEGEQYIGAPASESTGWVGAMSYANMMQHYGTYLIESELSALPQDWTTNDTLGSTLYNKHAELAKEAIWAHFEEFECLPDFLVGDTEVLGPFFMDIKVIDDGEA